MEFSKTDKTTMSRYPRKGSYDPETIYPIIDDALFCVVSYSVDNRPFAIPTGHARIDNQIYIHGSIKSHFLDYMSRGNPVCLTFSIMDGLKLAKSAFNHSFNYRSVTVFSNPQIVNEDVTKLKVLKIFTEKYIRGRWEDIRKPTDGEMKATQVIGFEIQEASAKISDGLPNDNPSDRELPIWSGIIPMQKGFGKPVTDKRYSGSIALPEYLQNLQSNNETA